MATRKKNIKHSAKGTGIKWHIPVIAAGLILLFVGFSYLTALGINPIIESTKAKSDTHPIIGIFGAAMFFIFAFLILFMQRKSRPSHITAKHAPMYQPLDSQTTYATDFPIEDEEEKPEETPNTWTLQLIKNMEWKIFGHICLAYLQERGIKAEASTHGADGSMNIKLYQDDTGNVTSIVHCKSWKKDVRIKEMKALLGAMRHAKVAKSFYMTSSGFTDEVKKVVKPHRINLIDSERLLMMIKRLPSESQNRLLAIATKGDYKTPSCPKCGVKMANRGGQWTCINFLKGCSASFVSRKAA